ncbi:hypothetical protein HN362_06200 [bacterium]|jgi:hypothetical protein|nr:hypothetical protein [bacterium]MBT3582015.1 hypothetical protein [bacterium]
MKTFFKETGKVLIFIFIFFLLMYWLKNKAELDIVGDFHLSDKPIFKWFYQEDKTGVRFER